MAITLKRLVSGSQLTTSAAVYYTAGTITAARIDKCVAANNSGSAASLTLHLVPTAGVADDTNKIIKTKSINAGETYTCPEVVGHVLAQGGTIQALASAGSAITLMVSGAEVT
jgi:hypothetical protein